MDSYPYGSLNGLSTEEIFIAVYLLVDRFLRDWIRLNGPLRSSPNGLEGKLSDAEVITIQIVGELQQMPSERAWYHEVETTWKSLFPNLISRNRYVERRVALGPVVDTFRRHLQQWVGVDSGPDRLVDSTPMKFAHIQRAKNNLNRRFRPASWLRDPGRKQLRVQADPGWADIGRCANKGELYFGMKLHLLVTPSRFPTAWMITPATTDDRKPVDALIAADPKARRHESICVWGDGGYRSKSLADRVTAEGHHIESMPQENEPRWPWSVWKTAQRLRQSVETGFSQLKSFVRLEHPRAHSLGGLMSEIAAKLTTLTLYLLGEHIETIIRSLG